MTRGIGRNQRRILDILLEHGQLMTPREIMGFSHPLPWLPARRFGISDRRRLSKPKLPKFGHFLRGAQ
jgi:hypothetical protein